MPQSRKTKTLSTLGPVAMLLLGIATGTPVLADSAPVVDHSSTTAALQALPPKALADRVVVTIYEFRSSVAEVSAGGSTDMFTTALIKSGQFRVVERERLQQGVVAEKQLNGAGQSTGTVAQQQLRGAQYIFEGTVSEANAGAKQSQGGVNIGGLTLGGGTNKDEIAIDVRVIDANTGDVLDAVDVSKALNSSNSSVGGTAAFAGTLASMRNRVANPMTPDVNYQNSRAASVDAALRGCIEEAVLQLIRRVNGTPTQ